MKRYKNSFSSPHGFRRKCMYLMEEYLKRGQRIKTQRLKIVKLMRRNIKKIISSKEEKKRLRS